MKLTVITPHRSPERKPFLDFLKDMMARQTRQPDQWLIVDYPATDDNCDLTARIKFGMQQAIGDYVLIMEDDDWYSPQYIETMAIACGHGRDIVGVRPSMMYNLNCRRYVEYKHPGRSSLFMTAIRRESVLTRRVWPNDSDPFLDLHLWRTLQNGYVFVHGDPYLAVGIKHGRGKCGSSHAEKRFTRNDAQLSWLISQIGRVDVDRYMGIISN
jgi:glycosyltransferase involved in cell wall biosynthesis